MRLKIFIGLLFLAGLGSCAQDELNYSCNPEIDAWAKENIQEIGKMNFEQISELPLSYQRAAYSAFSAPQRIAVWNEKLNSALELEWSSEEKEHILALSSIIAEHPYWFESTKRTKANAEAFEDEITLATYSWIEYARENLGWSQEQIYAVSASIGKVESVSGKLKSSSVISSDATSSMVQNYVDEPGPLDPDCECSLNSDWCMGGDTCGDEPCHATKFGGCGTLILYRCLGVCGYYAEPDPVEDDPGDPDEDHVEPDDPSEPDDPGTPDPFDPSVPIGGKRL